MQLKRICKYYNNILKVVYALHKIKITICIYLNCIFLFHILYRKNVKCFECKYDEKPKTGKWLIYNYFMHICIFIFCKNLLLCVE